MGESYGGKMMHGIMKAKWINVGETNIGKILSEINPETQRKRHNVAGRSLNSKIYNAECFGHKIYYEECLELFMCMLAMDFPVKQLDMLQWSGKTL